MSERQESGGTVYVYRAYDAEGQLLYVGMTNDLVRRFAFGHCRTHWIWDVASLTAEKYGTRREAHAAEQAAIRAENPQWNVQHKANSREAAIQYWAWERKRHTSDWPTRTDQEHVALSRRLRRLTWPIQYGVTLRPIDEAGEFIY